MNCLIFGATGQDGYFLSKLLLSKGYNVFGTSRFNENKIPPNNPIKNFGKNFQLLKCNIYDKKCINDIFEISSPELVFNFASQSSVAKSFLEPELTLNSIIYPILNILEVMRDGYKNVRLYNASSSEIFGNQNVKLNSNSQFQPNSPYAVGKTTSSMIVKLFRENYNLHAVNGYTFNHESIYRPNFFVTKKILTFVLKKNLLKGKDELKLGNIDIIRDWGLAEEYVEAMYLLLTNDLPLDSVICTGNSISLRDFVNVAFQEQGLEAKDFIKIEKSLFRKNELKKIYGDSLEAKRKIDWMAKTSGIGVVKTLIRQLKEKKNISP